MPQSFNARTIALTVLDQVDKTPLTLDMILDDVFREIPKSEKREKALAFSLIYGVLRHRGRLDWIIGHYSNTKFKKLHPTVLNILRLGFFQILYLDRIPVSAAVNTSVEMAKRLKAPWIHRYVNAMLRRAAGSDHKVVFPDMDADPIPGLAARMSFPPWLVSRWLERFGREQTRDLCDSLNAIPPLTIRVNTLKTDKISLHEVLSGNPGTLRYTLFAPDGLSLTGSGLVVEEMESFQNGWFQVQDEAAQLVGHLLGPQPGEIILDACAGRGGKTGHLAQLMKNTGTLIAVDAGENKLSTLNTEMRRLGVTIVSTRQADLFDRNSCNTLPLCDRILIDAPCSGLGVIRRNPDTKWKIQPGHLSRLSQNQIRLMNTLAGRVRPGGILVYAVCSMEPEENENVVNAFLTANKDFIVDDVGDGFPAPAKILKTSPGFFKTLPHIHDMDGFFSVRFKKTG